MWFISIPVRNISRRPVRSLLTIVGIAVAVGSFVSLLGLSRGLERSWVDSVKAGGVHAMVMRYGTVEFLTSTLDEKLAMKLKKIDGVKDVSGALIDLKMLDSGETVLIAGWPTNSFLWDNLRLMDGGGLIGPDKAMIGRYIKDALKKKVGDSIRLEGKDFEIGGVIEPSGNINETSIILNLNEMQALFGREGKVTAFNLRLSDPQNARSVEEVRRRIIDSAPNLDFTTTQRLTQDNKILGLMRAIAWSVSSVALVMALVIIVNTLLMSINERTREIGTLSAIGWRPGRIVSMILLEGLILAVIGSCVGAAIGINVLGYIASLPAIHGFIQPRLDLAVIAEVFIAAIVLGAIGSIYPAWRATGLNVVEALKYE